MRYALLLVMFATFMSVTSASTANKYGQLLLTDGNRILPNAIIPTPDEIVDIEVKASDVLATGSEAVEKANALLGTSQQLETRISLLEGKGLVHGACISFGSASVESNTNVTAQIIAYNIQSNTVDKTHINVYVNFSDEVENIGVEYAENYNGTYSRLETVADELTTYNSTECYRLEVAVPKADEQAFFRACADFVEDIVGQFNVWEGFQINGVSGMTTTNSIGVFLDGLLVEEIELAEAIGL